MIYRRRGWKDKVLFLAGENKETGTCSLADAEGAVVVTDLPLVADPSGTAPQALPKSYATPVAPAAERAPSTVDGAKVDEILAKAKDSTAAVDAKDLDRVNLPTLHAILEGLEVPAPADAKSKDLKQAILDKANATDPA